MKNNWQTKKLGELCEIITRGISPKYISAGGTQVLNQKCIRNHEINYQLSQLHNSAVKKINDGKIIRLGDVLVNSTGTGTLGRVAQVSATPSETTTVDSHITIVRPKIGAFFKDFFGYALIKIEKEIQSSGEGASGQTELPRKTLENNFSITYPSSFQEQERIVKKLDEVFEKIEKAKENTEKNLQNSRELFESNLQSIFANHENDWKEKKLGEIGQITSSKRIFKKEYAKTGIPFYRIKEIKELAHDKNITVELYISNERYNEIKSAFGMPTKGDILMTAVGTIGEVYVVNNDSKFYFKDGNVLWFKDFKFVDPHFLKYILISFVEQIKKLSQGSAYSALTIEKIEKHKIYLPSMREQKIIVKKLDALSEQTRKLEENYKIKLKLLEELKKSILQQAFDPNSGFGETKKTFAGNS